MYPILMDFIFVIPFIKDYRYNGGMKMEIELDASLVRDLKEEAKQRHTDLNTLIGAYIMSALVAEEVFKNELSAPGH
jgi:hypothetical protein